VEEKIVVQIDPDLREIVPAFLENRKKDLQTLERCLQERELETVRLLGHRMKGDGGGYGFNRISEIGGHLEHAALARDFAALRECWAQLQDFLTRVEVLYKR
jgi:HPt (histidine-containing phosphotransfer) domain-containing protein